MTEWGLSCHLIWHRNRVCFFDAYSDATKKPTKTCDFSGFLAVIEVSLLDYQDSNLGKQNQNLLCYHYTIVQT